MAEWTPEKLTRLLMERDALYLTVQRLFDNRDDSYAVVCDGPSMRRDGPVRPRSAPGQSPDTFRGRICFSRSRETSDAVGLRRSVNIRKLRGKFLSAQLCPRCGTRERYAYDASCVHCRLARSQALRDGTVDYIVPGGTFESDRACVKCGGRERYVKNQQCVRCAKVRVQKNREVRRDARTA